MSGADRTRRWRERLRAGKVAVTVEIDEPLVKALIEIGWLDARLSDSRENIRSAAQRMLDRLSSSVTRHDT
jgi:hypothetical protein